MGEVCATSTEDKASTRRHWNRVERFGSSRCPGFSAFRPWGTCGRRSSPHFEEMRKQVRSSPYAFPMTMLLLTAASWETVLRRSLLMAQGACTPAEYWRMGDEKAAAMRSSVTTLMTGRSQAAVLAPFVTRARANAKRLVGRHRLSPPSRGSFQPGRRQNPLLWRSDRDLPFHLQLPRSLVVRIYRGWGHAALRLRSSMCSNSGSSFHGAREL
jgi:hypothetical protein